MDTFDPDGAGARSGEAGPGAGEAGEPARVHYSTGRLTRAQARLVNAWRARLREDKPVPGQPRAGETGRPPGASGRPRASCSDAIAAAVAGLLATQPPAPLELARYAYASMQAQQAARTGRGAGEAAPLYPPASWYLPARVAGEAEQLRGAAHRAVLQARDEVKAEAKAQHPGGGPEAALARALFISGELARLRLPYDRQIPRGAIARMAIDQWARRSPARVAADAAAWARDVHEQPHRARRDMHELRR